MIEEPEQRRHVGPRQIVADLRHDGRTAPAEQQLHGDGHDRIAVARAEQDARPIPADRAGKPEDHPERFEPRGGKAGLGRHAEIEVRRMIARQPGGAAEHDRHLHLRVAPLRAKLQCGPLDAARLEAVKKAEDAHRRSVDTGARWQDDARAMKST